MMSTTFYPNPGKTYTHLPVDAPEIPTPTQVGSIEDARHILHALLWRKSTSAPPFPKNKSYWNRIEQEVWGRYRTFAGADSINVIREGFADDIICEALGIE